LPKGNEDPQLGVVNGNRVVETGEAVPSTERTREESKKEVKYIL